MDKEKIRNAEDMCLDATKKTNWKEWVKIAVAAVIGAIAAVLTMLQTSCTYTSSQIASDGSTANRVWAIDAATARDLIKLYGAPEVPTVNVTK